jgi:hypothetical protein
MDMLSHALWADIGRRVISDNSLEKRRLIGWLIAGALLPDIFHAIPVSIWALFGTGSPWDAVLAYALATPGTEPLMPAWVVETSRVVHCSLHSAVLAGLISLLICSGGNIELRYTFTHSAAYYPVRTFYPLSEWSFDGWAWNSPAFIATNYLLLGLVYLGIGLSRQRPWESPGRQEKDIA